MSEYLMASKALLSNVQEGTGNEHGDCYMEPLRISNTNSELSKSDNFTEETFSFGQNS